MSEPGGFDFEEIRRMLQQMGIMGDDGAIDLDAVMRRMQSMAGQGGVVFGMPGAEQNPDAAWLTTITAAKHATTEAGPDPEILPEQRAAVVDGERIAQSWLDEFTAYAAPGVPARCITRTQWLEATSSGWRSIVEPIVTGLGDALQHASSEGAGAMPGMDLAAMMGPLMRQSASAMYRERLKRVLAAVARDTLTGTEVGVNLFAGDEVVIVPANVDEFTRDLDADTSDMLLVLLLREAARERLFRGVGWLSPQILALMTHYAREITIDLDAIAERLSPERLEELSLEDLNRLGQEVQVSFFRPASTPEQLKILERLGVLLALVEGWVDHITARTMEKWMPHAPQLTEVLRRRRAAEGPVRTVFKELLGLETPPRLVRDASNLWAAVEHVRGSDQRDEVWAHPDLLPTAQDLADPIAFAARATVAPQDDLDAELRKLLDE